MGSTTLPTSKRRSIVEGECDKLALEEAGFRNVLSVPDGAPSRLKDTPSDDDAKFAFLANCEEELNRVKKFILAVDNDANGLVLEEELARRLGKERCWRVRWPDGNDAPCKDARETLLAHGPEVALPRSNASPKTMGCTSGLSPIRQSQCARAAIAGADTLRHLRLSELGQ
jgi:Toprim domain